MKKLLFVTMLFVGVMCCACSRAGEDVSGWVDLLEQEGKISVDLDGYLGEETIVLTNEEFEGEQRIKELYVLLNDEKVVIPGVITDSSLESIMKFDFDKDGHSDYQVDLVSVVAYDTDLGMFQVEDSWVEK